jgi:hypothetical protein
MSSLPRASPSPSSGRSHRRQNSLELWQYAKHLQEKYIVHPYWSNASMGKITEVGHVPDIDIAEAGAFKYVLIEVRSRGPNYGHPKLVVRGDASCAYHGKKRSLSLSLSLCAVTDMSIYFSGYLRKDG